MVVYLSCPRGQLNNAKFERNLKRNKNKIGLKGDITETNPFEITTLKRCFQDRIEVNL